MKLIFDQNIRNQIENSLKLVSALIPELGQQNMNLERIDAICQVLITDSRLTVANAIHEHIGNELSLAYFGVIITGIMSITLEENPVLPEDWISPGGTPNPNFIISKMLVSATNYALAVIHLVEAGLEAPARANLRTFLELSWLIMVTSARREKLIIYAQEVDDKAERKLYHKHFAASKLRRGLLEIEKITGIAEIASLALSDLRTELYGFYFKAIHNAFSDATIGAFAFSFEDDRLFSSLFGKADKASYPTLYHLNDANFYFLNTFGRILSAIHGFQPPYSVEWQKVLAMQESFNHVVTHPSRREVAAAFKRAR